MNATANTKTLELHTATVNDILDHLDNEGRGQTMSIQRQRAIVDEIEAQTGDQNAILICGLPGAGKSVVGKMLSDIYDTQYLSMGNILRVHAPAHHKRSNTIGEWASDVREHKPEAIAEWTTDCVGNRELTIIDGLRSTADYDVFGKFFDNIVLVYVDAPFYTRLTRLQERGRDDEASFDGEDLARRDDREITQGVGGIISHDLPDWAVLNHGRSRNELSLQVEEMAFDHLPFPVSTDD